RRSCSSRSSRCTPRYPSSAIPCGGPWGGCSPARSGCSCPIRRTASPWPAERIQGHWACAFLRSAAPGMSGRRLCSRPPIWPAARTMLELGTGTGETARRLLARHPGARLVGIDASEAMLAAAQTVLPGDRVRLLAGRLEEPLPGGAFDLVASALCVHHLDGRG